LREPHLREGSSFSWEERGEQYEYIIVGGGTAGCPLAATLSHNYTVLLLERGGSPYGNVNVSYMRNFHISLADTAPTSPAQPFISTDGVINARARVLGGGTCINAGFYTRASTRYWLLIHSFHPSFCIFFSLSSNDLYLLICWISLGVTLAHIVSRDTISYFLFKTQVKGM